MSGVVFALGQCYGCGRIFAFNVDRVPSVPIKGQREPICRSCVERANPLRVANGLDPIVILPGAYEPGPIDGGLVVGDELEDDPS